MNQPVRILVAMADRGRRAELAALLEARGFVALVADQAGEAQRVAREESPDLLLLGHGGRAEELELLGALRAALGEELVPVVCLSNCGAGCEGRGARLEALRAGADEVLDFSCDAEELALRLTALLRWRRQHRALAVRAEELEQLSVTDALTGLYNRRLFEARLREEFSRAQRYGDPLGLLMVDLDHFKQVNDRYGHLLGDEVLRGTAEVLRGCVRDSDLVTRFGGEEFALILPRTPLAGALAVAERIWRALGKARFGRTGVAIRVTASLGVAGLPAMEVRVPADLVDAADRALYRAKRAGRDRIGLPPGAPGPASLPPQGEAGATEGWVLSERRVSH
jgi:diguanylate cyclase (GGDEF)-like protein